MIRHTLVAAALLLALPGLSTGQDASVRFVRGDANNDSLTDISDGVTLLVNIFLDPTPLPCADAADANDSGSVDLGDASTIFNLLFQKGPEMAAPWPDCGVDPTADALACSEYAHCAPTPVSPRNVLLIISDDLGVDQSNCYGSSGSLAPSPNLESLCASGVVFRNAWTNPVCSPTRACLLTGRYGFRTGVGDVPGGGNAAIGLDEFTLPQALNFATEPGYANACIGKWHLATNQNGGADHPNLMGFDHYSGAWQGAIASYFVWDKTVNGVTETVNNYRTSENVDDALAWIGQQGDAPWFLWLAVHSPHSPFHLPPNDLHSFDGLSGTEADINANPVSYYQAAIEAMDTEIGRLLSALDPDVRARTDIIYLGDNGTPARIARGTPSEGRAKGSLYEGGVHVPLIISGPSVVDGGREVDSIVNSTDLFATVLELAGVELEAVLPSGTTVDSVSLVPYLENPEQESLRDWVIAERFGIATDPDQIGKTIRDEAYKLIRYDSEPDALYDLRIDALESDNLLLAPLSVEAQSHLDSLNQTLDALLASE